MREILLDGSLITDKNQLHTIFAQGFSFPEWYGNNLDALYDCLTDVREETSIKICSFGRLRDNLGGYADKVKKVLRNAEADNRFVHLIIVREEENESAQ